MLQHKKFQAAIVASLLALLGGLSPAFTDGVSLVDALLTIDWNLVIAPWLVAIGAQGVADLGKERAKIEQITKR